MVALVNAIMVSGFHKNGEEEEEEGGFLDSHFAVFMALNIQTAILRVIMASCSLVGGH